MENARKKEAKERGGNILLESEVQITISRPIKVKEGQSAFSTMINISLPYL
jgi:hypothetical protein